MTKNIFLGQPFSFFPCCAAAMVHARRFLCLLQSKYVQYASQKCNLFYLYIQCLKASHMFQTSKGIFLNNLLLGRIFFIFGFYDATRRTRLDRKFSAKLNILNTCLRRQSLVLYCCLPPEGGRDSVSITISSPAIVETATSCLFTGDVWVFFGIKSSGTVME